MKMLLIHADHFEYSVRQPAIKNPEEIGPERKSSSMNEVLVAFCTVEKDDEINASMISINAVDAIDSVAKQVEAQNIIVYPYAHLSPSLGSRDMAISILTEISLGLRERKYEVVQSPFGWYKSFTNNCKGHPLSELSRSIVAETPLKGVEIGEETTFSSFIILEQDGTENLLTLDDIESCVVLEKYDLLKQFIISEEIGKEHHEAPPHIDLMRRLELVDYEPASDIGHFRYYPKGALVKMLLEEYATKVATHDLKAMRIDTPSLYRLDQPDIASQAARFGEKDYRFKIEDRDLTLRFAGDFGLFRMMKDATFSYKQLPIRIYELSPSFRLEQRGECVGLKRLRAFTMPDIHCFCKDLKQGMEDYEEVLRHYTRHANALGIDYVVAFRVYEKFYHDNKDWFVNLLKIVDKPALFELLPLRKHYWIAKHEFQTIDSVGGSAQLSTVQLDVEDSERYNITYVDSDGVKKGCIIVHSSLGSIERWIYALLEQAEKMRRKSMPPMLPVWCSPTQVRILPVTNKNLDYSMELVNLLELSEIRVDIDDRDTTLGNKIREAEVNWIPYIVVVGDKEKKNKTLSVRIRSSGERVTLSVDALIEMVDIELEGAPRSPLNMPVLISLRPKFI